MFAFLLARVIAESIEFTRTKFPRTVRIETANFAWGKAQGLQSLGFKNEIEEKSIS